MDSYPIKSVLFGGFDKEDVIRYLENFAKSAAEERKELLAENERLQSRTEALEDEIAELTARLEEADAARNGLEEKVQEETALREELEPLRTLSEENSRLREEAERLRGETDQLRRDAAAYAQFRDRLGAIECEARERADALEASASEKVRRTVFSFNAQYQDIIQSIESTASHVAGELRKVEFNLSQLPRAMDQAGRELTALTDRVARGEDGETGRAQ